MNLKCGEEVHFNSGITRVLPVFDPKLGACDDIDIFFFNKQEGEVDFN